MTDTDKLKRLSGNKAHRAMVISTEEVKAILALIAENERVKRERDEAVALLREFMNEGNTSSVYNDILDFLARIDNAEST